MRSAICSASCLLPLLLTTLVTAQETKAPWWKFGMGEETTAAPPYVTSSPTMTPAPETITPIEEDSWFAMPKWHWPTFASDADAAISDKQSATDAIMPTEPAAPRRRIPLPRYGNQTERSRPRNTWAQQPASTETPAAEGSTWQNMKQGTRNAWDKTVDFVTPGHAAETTAVASKPRSSWWQKMWGSDQPDEGPQTVTEWMAQDRIDP
jgi:hypothetical protein